MTNFVVDMYSTPGHVRNILGTENVPDTHSAIAVNVREYAKIRRNIYLLSIGLQ